MKVNVIWDRPPVGLCNSYIENVKDEEEAIRVYREKHGVDQWEREHKRAALIRTVTMDNSPVIPPEAPFEPEPKPEPKPDVGTAPQRPPEPAAEPAPPESDAAPHGPDKLAGAVNVSPDVDALKPYGISDKDVTDLRNAELNTVDDVIRWMRAHKTLVGIGGIGVPQQDTIKKAIVALKAEVSDGD